MKFTVQSILGLLGLASANPHLHDPHHWHPPGPGDFRGPCPMMNTLANHNFLPHDGRNLTREVVVDALASALNFNESLGSLMFDMAIVANPQPNATYFTLDHLNRHNVLEHDASLSRADAAHGSNHIFNRTIFAQTRAFWTAETLTAQMLANSKIARQIVSRAFNPNYTFTASTEQFSLGEVAAPIIVFGNMDKGEVDRGLVEYFFENERLPTELGWTTKSEPITQEAVLGVSLMIDEAQNLLTGSTEGSGSASAHARGADLHSGLRL
ncbi:Putative Chloroperoxidase [Aspergillus calidoustus]|uniref:Putative Chloroperoxidase n=1 Tax=Aspergillus calidoustus TaxID=454130 RepID=A0A0U5GCC9_ASPCI|nr:Putative Chloroperoxidase [Aspergillus calidoustus]